MSASTNSRHRLASHSDNTGGSIGSSGNIIIVVVVVVVVVAANIQPQYISVRVQSESES